MEPILEEIFESVIEGNAVATHHKVQKGLDEGISAHVILNDSMISAMTEVGRLFEEGEYFVPEMLIAARAMQAGLGLACV